MGKTPMKLKAAPIGGNCDQLQHMVATWKYLVQSYQIL